MRQRDLRGGRTGNSFACVLAVALILWTPIAADAQTNDAFEAEVAAPELGGGGSVIVEPAPEPEPVMLRAEVFAEVRMANGAPVEGAVVLTSAGGQGVTDATGVAIFEIEVSPEAQRVLVTAAASSAEDGLNYKGRVEAALVHFEEPGVDGEASSLSCMCDAGVIVVEAGNGCEPEWVPTFGGQPGVGGTSSSTIVQALLSADVIEGPSLYIGGLFSSAGGIEVSNIARWDGSGWSSLGGGMDGRVGAIHAFDDGSGPSLFAGGTFSIAAGVPALRIAKWDGVAWSPVGSGINGTAAASMATFDDGSGPALFVGGSFNEAGGTPASGIAKWNGDEWSALGDGLTGGFGGVFALAVFDDASGAGPALYAGGGFSRAGSVDTPGIARWNGEEWTALSHGLNGRVFALAAFDDGQGPRLFAGGDISRTGGTSFAKIARWNGQTWSPAGSLLGDVAALAVFDDGSGSGPALHAGGRFNTSGSTSPRSLARWNGVSWVRAGSGVGGVSGPSINALASFDDGLGSGPGLYAGGSFSFAGGIAAHDLARWDGQSYTRYERGPDGPVGATIAFDDEIGQSTALIAAGDFADPDGNTIAAIAQWIDGEWSSLGAGIQQIAAPFSPFASGLALFDDGSGEGEALFVAGRFDMAGGLPAKNIAKWNGREWSPLGEGLDRNAGPMAVFDDQQGGGPALFVAGTFSTAGNIEAAGIARWDGDTWSALGVGVRGSIFALAEYDDGGGPALYVAGRLLRAGGLRVEHIARWDGSAWNRLPSDIQRGASTLVSALHVFDDGRGPSLYVGGRFTQAGDVLVNGLARWNGQWHDVGGSVGPESAFVGAFATFNDGTSCRPTLYVGGQFATAGGTAATRFARWDGRAWSPVGTGFSGSLDISGPSISSMAIVDDDTGAGEALFVAGSYLFSPAGDSFLARYQGCEIQNSPPSCPPSPPPTHIWPPNHQYVEIDIASLIEVTDPAGDEVTIEVTSITQDEPVNGIGDGNTSCDGEIVVGTVVRVRAERARGGDGRVYRVGYTASDPCGGTCTGSVEIHVLRNQGDSLALHSGNEYDSTAACLAPDDLNGNGLADFGDILIALETYGQSGPDDSLNWPDGDASGDAAVDMDDLVSVLQEMIAPATNDGEDTGVLGTE